MRTTCFGQKRYIYICVLQIDQPIPPWKASQTGFHVFKVFPRNTHLSPEGFQWFQHQQWSCRTRFCGYHVGTQFFSFQPSADMFASGLPELGFSSRVKEWGIHQCNKRFKEDTLGHATIHMEIEWCHAPWQGRKKRYQASALHFAHFAHFVASLSSISGRLHTLGIHCDFKTSSRRLKQHETVAPSLLPGLDFYNISL